MGEEYFRNLYTDYKQTNPNVPDFETFVANFATSETRKSIYTDLVGFYGKENIPDYQTFELGVNQNFSEIGFEELPVPLLEAGNYVRKLSPQENVVVPSKYSQSATVYKEALKNAGVGEIAELLDTQTINGNTLKAYLDQATEEGRLNEFIASIAANSVPNFDIDEQLFSLEKTVTTAEASRPIEGLAKEAPNPEEDKEVDLAIEQLQNEGIDSPDIDQIKEVLTENKINKARETSVVYKLNKVFKNKLSVDDLDDLFDSIYDKTFLENIGEGIGGLTQSLSLHSVDVIKDRAESLLSDYEEKTGVQLDDKLFDQLANQLANEYDKNTGASEFVGELGGYVIPLGLTSKVVRGALSKVAPNLTAKAAEGTTAQQFLLNAVETLPADILDASFVATDREGNFDSEAFLSQLALDIGLGGVIGTALDKFGVKRAAKEADKIVDDLNLNGDIKKQLQDELDIEAPLEPKEVIKESIEPEIISNFKEKIRNNPEQFVSDDDLIRDFVNNRAQILKPSFFEDAISDGDEALNASINKKLAESKEEVALFLENADLLSPTIRDNYDFEGILENITKEDFDLTAFKRKNPREFDKIKPEEKAKLSETKPNELDKLIKDSWARGARTQDKILDDVINNKNLTDDELDVIEDTVEDYFLRQTEPSIGDGSKIDGVEGETIREQIAKANLSIKGSRATGERSNAFVRKRVEENIKRQNEKIADADFVKFREENLLEPETLSEVIMRTRGIITDAEALERAKSIKVTTSDILNLPKGTVLNKEQRFAFSSALNRERAVRKKLSELIDGGGAGTTKEERVLIERIEGDFKELPEDQLLVTALEQQSKVVKQLEIMDLGLRSEAGRSLQALKKDVAELDLRLNTLYTRIKNRPAIERQAIIERIVNTNLDDNKRFLELIREVSEPSFIEKFAEYSVAAKLWNPTTHIVNLAGNTLRQVADLAITAGTNPKALMADLAGISTGMRHGLKQALRALTDEGYAATLSKYIETGGIAPAIGGKLGTIARTPFRFLGAGDQIFRSIAYQRSLYRQAFEKVKGMKGNVDENMKTFLEKPTFEMMEEAQKQASRMTFQEEMPELVRKINSFRNIDSSQSKGRQLSGLVFRLFVPFLKTPLNLARQAVDFSPLGFLKVAKNRKKYFVGGEITEEGRRRIGEAVIGTSIIATGISLLENDLLTGGAPKEKKARALFYSQGKLPYSVKINDTWVQYKRVEPFSTILSLVADIGQLSEDKTEDDGKFMKAVSHIGSQVKDKTFLQGFSSFMDLFGSDWERERAVKNIVVGSTLPSFVGAISRTVDPTIRESEGVLEAYQAAIPFASKNLPARIDFLGNAIERSNQGLNYLFNPIQTSIEEIDPITKELIDLDYPLPLPRTSFDFDGEKIELDGKQFEKYSKQIGNKIKEDILKAIEHPRYKRMDAEKKVKHIKQLRAEAMKEAKVPFIARHIKKNFEGREQRRKLRRAGFDVIREFRKLK